MAALAINERLYRGAKTDSDIVLSGKECDILVIYIAKLETANDFLLAANTSLQENIAIFHKEEQEIGKLETILGKPEDTDDEATSENSSNDDS